MDCYNAGKLPTGRRVDGKTRINGVLGVFLLGRHAKLYKNAVFLVRKRPNNHANGSLDAFFHGRLAYQANAHDFIMEFPEGYDTNVGDDGRKLSGGQKQVRRSDY